MLITTVFNGHNMRQNLLHCKCFYFDESSVVVLKENDNDDTHTALFIWEIPTSPWDY